MRRRRDSPASVVMLAVALVLAACGSSATDDTESPAGAVGSTPLSSTTASPGASTSTTEPGGDRRSITAVPGVDPDPDGGSDPEATTTGLLTFRGGPTRSYYGTGPVPTDPEVIWRYPDEAMCSLSVVAGVTSEWCGTGWTGQPAVFERTGRTWLVFGAYDGAVHFLDAATGRTIRPSFQTGDLIKGSVTIDPDGFPIVYVGSRDNAYRAIAFDRAVPTELWRIEAHDVSPVLWNDDWDGAGLVSDGLLYIGGENGQFHVVELNRSYDAEGMVSADPSLVFNTPAWDEELLAAIGDTNVSIEGSVALADGVVWFANSGGLVQGWDVSTFESGGTPSRVFRYWTGDDVDATVVLDSEGALYVGVEWERHTARGREVGQVIKLDPARPDPLVWSIADRGEDLAGVWGTPALWRDLVVVPTNEGRLLGIDRSTGVIRWTKNLPGPLWSSPVIVDGVLLQGDCSGVLHAYDLSDTKVDPPELWTVRLGGCIESTPAVWEGTIYVGTRGGHVHAVS